MAAAQKRLVVVISWRIEQRQQCSLTTLIDDYNHLNDDDLNEDERWIKKADSKKRVKVGRRRGKLIPVGPVEPNYEGMTAIAAYETKHKYLN